MADEDLISISKLPCCPEVTREPCCDRLLFTYRLEHNLTDIPVDRSATAANASVNVYVIVSVNRVKQR